MKNETQGIYRVDWFPGSDQLIGTCFCGAEHVGDDPVEMWTWLLGHPFNHTESGPDRVPMPGGSGRAIHDLAGAVRG